MPLVTTEGAELIKLSLIIYCSQRSIRLRQAQYILVKYFSGVLSSQGMKTKPKQTQTVGKSPSQKTFNSKDQICYIMGNSKIYFLNGETKLFLQEDTYKLNILEQKIKLKQRMKARQLMQFSKAKAEGGQLLTWEEVPVLTTEIRLLRGLKNPTILKY